MKKNPLDCIVFIETWLNEDEKFKLYGLKNYNSVELTRPKKTKGGGISIYINNEWKHSVITKVVKANIEALLIEIYKKTDEKKKVLGVYRPPKGNVSAFLNEIEQLLNDYSDVMILGDLNIDVSSGSSTSVEINQLFRSFDYVQANKFVTREDSGTIIDHIWIKDRNTKCDVYTLEKNSLSDHSAIVLDMGDKKTSRNQVTKVKKTDVEQAIANIRNEKYDLLAENDVNTAFSNVISSLQKHLRDCTTELNIKHKATEVIPPWANKKFSRKLNHINNLDKKIRRRKKMKLPHDHLCHKLNTEKKKLDEYSSKQAKKYFMSMIRDGKMVTWDAINEICGRKRKQKINSLKRGNDIIEDDIELANYFNEEFSKVNGIKLSANESRVEDLDPSNQSSMVFHEVTENEMFYYLNSICARKATGSDNIPGKVWKEIKDVHYKLITKLFNKIIREATYPDVLKLARVIPVHKSGDKLDAGNYRAISLLPTINKIIERILYDQLVAFLEKNDLFDPHQYGFRKGRNTRDAVAMLLTTTARLMDKNKKVALIFLDIKKAFDTVDHEILLQKLEKIGIRGKANDIIRNYLASRSQHVSIADKQSANSEIKRGVPQGSCLGPLLFLMLIYDMKYLKLESLALKFADDLCVIAHGDTTLELAAKIEKDLALLKKYYDSIGLLLNFSKTKCVKCFKYNCPSLAEVLMNEGIEIIKGCNYLGVKIEGDLRMRSFIENLIDKLSNSLRVISIIRHYLPINCLISFFHAYFLSHINDAGFVLLRAREKDLRKLQRMMNRALKMIHNLNFRHSTYDIFTTYAKDLLPIAGYVKLSAIIQVKRCLEFTDGALPMLEVIESGRREGDLKIERFKKMSLKKDIVIWGAKMFNKIPLDLRIATFHDAKLFKKTVAKLLRTELVNRHQVFVNIQP